MSTALPTVSAPKVEGTPSIQLVATLAVAGAVAGFFIVLVHLWSQPRILEYQARVLADAVFEVLGGPESTRTFYLIDGAFTDQPAAAADTASSDRVFVGFDAAGEPVGVALSAAEPGFQDVIRLIFGYDPASAEVLGMKVLESKETPGLGDKIEKDSSFVAEFRQVATPLVGVKPGSGDGVDGEIDMITGATISSRAIIDIINHRLEAIDDEVQALWRTAPSRTARAGSAP